MAPYHFSDSMLDALISHGGAILALRYPRVLRKIFPGLPADLVPEGDRPYGL
jgi:hypothetical protein